MLVLITYDISQLESGGASRLRKVAQICQNYGQRVQFSVFECSLDPALWARVKNQLKKNIDKEKDSLRFYYLGSNWKKRVEHIGTKQGYDVEGPLII